MLEQIVGQDNLGQFRAGVTMAFDGDLFRLIQAAKGDKEDAVRLEGKRAPAIPAKAPGYAFR